MVKIESKNVIVEHERRTVTPAAKESIRRRLLEEKERTIAADHTRRTSCTEQNVALIPEASQVRETSDTTSSKIRTRREAAISRGDVENVGKQIKKLKRQIDSLKKQGELVKQNKNSPFANKILVEVVGPSFRLLDLPKYDGSKDPREHVSAFELTINFKKTVKRSATYLFTIWQKGDESLKSFIGRFNNETLAGSFAWALARDPREDVEQLMRLAQKNIDEEEMNAIKDKDMEHNMETAIS
ncbi:UNVERIFIED_CONTAM: hypothetical protein Sindi_1261900 [Sesamum indicum]